MNKQQTKQLEDAISHIQEARALLTDYFTDRDMPESGNVSGRLNGLVNEVHNMLWGE